MLGWIGVGFAVVVMVAFLIFEFRVRKVDQLVVYESQGHIRPRKGRLYPRHFSALIPTTFQSMTFTIDAEAAGKLPIQVRLAISATVSLEHLDELIRAGVWDKASGLNAAPELEILFQGFVREVTEGNSIADLSCSSIKHYLNEKKEAAQASLGLDIVALSVQSIEPLDAKIAEAMRQQEEAKIREKTEKTEAEARVAAAGYRVEADKRVALLHHEKRMRELELQELVEEREQRLAEKRLAEELRQQRMRLAVEKEELDLVKDKPELLMLTPQMARLAEASQSLKNARTIVSLSPQTIDQGSQLADWIRAYLQSLKQHVGERAEPSPDDRDS